jgi:murein DD-endopeptidase MepM/ murein hydrolase activator NlpD
VLRGAATRIDLASGVRHALLNVAGDAGMAAGPKDLSTRLLAPNGRHDQGRAERGREPPPRAIAPRRYPDRDASHDDVGLTYEDNDFDREERPRSGHGRFDRAATLNPGNEPPLTLDGGRAPDRRRVSVRWLTGTILTGLFGATLMGGAVYAALDGEYTFARAPLAVAINPRDVAMDSRSNSVGKADRILMETNDLASRQVVRISTTTKIGDKDVIKVKPFARVMASLALTSGEHAAEVPPYNPISIFAGANPEPAVVGPPAMEDDGEVTVVARGLADVAVASDNGLTLPLDQVRSVVHEQASFEANAVTVTVPPQVQLFDPPTGEEALSTSLAFASPDEIGPPPGIEVNIVPENLTEIGKTGAVSGLDSKEQTIVVRAREMLGDILGGLGASAAEVKGILAALGPAAAVNEGQRLRILVEHVPAEGGRGRPVRISVYNADQHQGTVALSDNGDYVTVEDPDATEVANAGQDDGEDDFSGGIRLYHSIFETSLKQKVPKEMVEDLLRIFAYDVDLNRRTRPGDNLEIFYEQDESGAPQGGVLYTSLSVDGELRRYYRFISPDDGQVDYYDEDGRSARKFLMRKPVNAGEMRSTFGMRKHPVLGYYKMHTGVDWGGLPVGTPILATGNGTLVKAGWAGGYGRHIEIQHANGYMTTYSHMSGFAKGMAAGTKVKLGQVIGYLGSTGLSTGPHIHYEVKINNNLVDPMRIKLPQGRELSGNLLATFKQERERIDAMMSKAPVAQAATGSKGT